MKTLIVSYSFSGNNELLANYLQKRLGADMFRVTERRKRTGFTIFLDILLNRTPAIREFYHARNLYEHYVFVGPVWAGRIASPLKAFLVNESERIGKYSFISVCGGSPHQKERIARKLLAMVGHEPDTVAELALREVLKAKGKIQSTTGYKLTPGDLQFFAPAIDEFVRPLAKTNKIQNEPVHN